MHYSHDVCHNVFKSATRLYPHNIKIVERSEFSAVEPDDLIPYYFRDTFLPCHGDAHGLPQHDIHIKEGAAYTHHLILVLQVEQIIINQLRWRDQFLCDLIGNETLDRSDKTRVSCFLFKHRLQVIQELRKPVHGNCQKNEIVIINDTLQVIRCIDRGR